jgi:hypothetical protein
MKRCAIVLMMGMVFPQLVTAGHAAAMEDQEGAFTELPAEILWDKIRGGLLGQMLGNLNGIPHEFKYINEPGNVGEYTPALPEGARTDDDTDLEWVYVDAMQRHGTILIPVQDMADLWRTRINRRIWCSNQYARVLMDLGIEPPLTGNIVLNPWAEFNISGQFLCETFALLAPGMPRTAAKIGLHYTQIAIDGEPAQTTELFTTMIATAFLTEDVDNILDAGQAALDPASVLNEIMNDVRDWQDQYPGEWRTTRRLIKDKYGHHGGAMRDKNGYELNSAAIIASLAYGQGDFSETLRTAFNFGWDADCNAATAGTIMGVTRGYRWMMAQGWDIRDRYVNTTRQQMPMDETITSFADRLISLAEQVIIQQGGQRLNDGLKLVYRIPREKPANVSPLLSRSDEMARIQDDLRTQIESSLVKTSEPRARARAAYLAIAVGLSKEFQQQHPEKWAAAINDLGAFPQLAQVLYHHSPVPAAVSLRQRAAAAGVTKPDPKNQDWLWQQTTDEGAKKLKE